MVRLKIAYFVLVILAAGLLAGAPAAAQTISLDGHWHFVTDPAGTLKLQGLPSLTSVPLTVPGSWQAQLADRRDYAGVAWYFRSFTLEKIPAERLALLRFGAVDYRAEVYVNGQKTGTHDGGYLPFEFDVTAQLRAGENQVAVRVTDPGPPPRNSVEGINYAEIPHGKQDWYVETSGLWQSVELEFRPRAHLAEAHVTADAEGDFRIEAHIANPPAAPLALTAEMTSPAGATVWQGRQALDPNQGAYTFSGKLAQADLWSPSNPALYSLRVQLSSGDARDVRFGFRTFQTRDGKFYLNGKTIYLRGALDQAFYPETIYTPPSLDYLRAEMRQAKALGLNLLRCHMKVPDPRYLEAADETGMLVWYEIPFWDKPTAGAEARALDTLRGMAARDWNHPSIVLVTLVSESRGLDLHEAAGRNWLKSAYEQANKIVPGWLVDDNSACCENFHLATDLADFHQYEAVPGHAEDFDRLVGDFATRPRWLFSPYGDAAPKGDEPLVLSEFGNWGLPKLHDPEPWWFARGFKGNPMTVPAGVQERFREFGYASLFPSFDALAEATEEHQFRALRYEIGSLRRRAQIQGYVITQLTDVTWEANGLLDMWRRPKVFAPQLARLQQDDALVVRAETRNFAAGARAQAQVYFSHYGAEPPPGATVSWKIPGTSLNGSFALPAVPFASAAKAGDIAFTVPAVSAPERRTLQVELAGGGKTLADNSLQFYFYPSETPLLPPLVSFHDPHGRLRRLVNEMRARNYQAPAGHEAFPVLISSTWDDQVKQTLGRGGIVILLTSSAQTLAPGLEVVPRSQDGLDGNWISDFLWVRPGQAPFQRLGFAPLPGFETQEVTPQAVVRGIPPEDFSDVLAGMFYGWIQSNAGVLVEARCGKGKLIICTFSLSTSYGTDPYATALLDALVEYAVSGHQPHFRIPL
jgi:Glycosyl hydrolases family 2, sugar binding domain/Glycosyl hydrolases family 2